MKKDIELQPKKPKLAYVGMDKKTLVEAVPTQVVEIVYPHRVDAPKKNEGTRLFEEGQIGIGNVKKSADFPKNRLIWTNDNLVALKTLLDEKDPVSGEYKYRNKIDLIYIDPPFMVQDDFVAQNSIDIEVTGDGESFVKEPTIIEIIAYKDTWQNGLDSFLQMMRERLELMKELLSPAGSIYVHLDYHVSHYIKVLMDEIFDYQLFRNEITWRRQVVRGMKGYAEFMPFSADYIMIYSKTKKSYWEPIEKLTYITIEEAEEKYQKDERGYFRTSDPGTSSQETLYNLAKEGRIYVTHGGSLIIDDDKKTIRATKGSIAVKYYRKIVGDAVLEESVADNIWDDVPGLGVVSSEATGYPTQKTIGLLRRIIKSSCPKGGIILDAFMGSGTTCEAAEQLAEELGCTWIGIDNSKFAIHTARKRLIELNSRSKPEKNAGMYKVRPFTVENMGYYQRGVKWDPIQVSNQADAYRQAIIELFGGEYAPYSKLLHGKKRGSWIHVGPLSQPLVAEQVLAIAKEVKDTEFKKCYVLSADFTAHLNSAIEQAKEKYDVQVTARIIPASAVDEVKKRLDLMREGADNPKKASDMPNIAFFAPLTVKIHKVADGKEAMIELAGLEVDTESFLESQKPERRDGLKKWLEKEKSWQSFVDFWAIDWDYESLKDPGDGHGPVFENEWQSFRKSKGKKVVEDLIFKAFHTYEKAGEYTIAVKVTDIFGNDGIVTAKVVIKK